LHAKSGTDKTYEFTFSNGVKWRPPAGTFPRYSINTLKAADEEGKIWFGKNGTAVQRLKKYLAEMKQGVIPKTIWLYDEVGSNDDAKRVLKGLFDDNPFDSPKPPSLIKQIIKLSSDDGDIVLDSFAGSGTTGHAVMDLNKENGGNRKFIMVEMEDAVARDITAERVRRAIKKNGYKDGFEYCELDKPLFNEEGQIEAECDFKQLATYIYFTETQTNIDPKGMIANFIGGLGQTEYYLIYKGKDKNDLDKSFLKKLKKTDDKKVVYADRCLLNAGTLAEYNIIFKQIPYEVKVY
jgi:adenine-specific DNA-methyltransferase